MHTQPLEIKQLSPGAYWTLLLVLLGTVGTIAGAFMHSQTLVLVFKPLAMLTLIAWAALMRQRSPDRLHTGIFVGLLFSMAGDILLIWPQRLFLAGLCAFLCAHIAYITAFSQGVALPLKPVVRLPFIVFAMAMWAVLHQNLGTILKFAVAVYAIVLVSMASQSWIWHGHHKKQFSLLAVIGSILFVASDTLIAVDRFHTPLPYASAWILLTYFPAQWLITASISESRAALARE